VGPSSLELPICPQLECQKAELSRTFASRFSSPYIAARPVSSYTLPSQYRFPALHLSGLYIPRAVRASTSDEHQQGKRCQHGRCVHKDAQRGAEGVWGCRGKGTVGAAGAESKAEAWPERYVGSRLAATCACANVSEQRCPKTPPRPYGSSYWSSSRTSWSSSSWEVRRYRSCWRSLRAGMIGLHSWIRLS
jgi:ribosomal protein L37AE/L43A